jgi:hypothetical protein
LGGFFVFCTLMGGVAGWCFRLFAGIRLAVFAAQVVSVFWGFSLASACCLRASSVAPVRGGTYFSLPPQRKVGKRKRLTPPTFLLA